MSRTLVLLRHGQTAWNAQERAQGQADVPLDETGLAQARAVAPVLAAMAPARLWSSDLARAWQTATQVALATGLSVEPEPAFREHAIGEARTGLTLAEYEAAHPAEFADFLAGRAVPGRETHDEVIDRFVPALEKAAAGLADGECGVVVSHGAAIRSAVPAFLGLGGAVREAFGGLGNCHWIELRESVPTFGGGELRWRMRGWNLSAPTGATPDFAPPLRIG